jgi:hypothetical protein
MKHKERVMEKIKKGFLPHLPFLFLFFSMLFIDQYIYMYGDDYRYATYFSLFPHFKGDEFTISQAIQNQIYDYTHVNGRFFVNIFSIFMLVSGIEVWRWLNPFVIVFLAYLIFYAVFVRLPKKRDHIAGTLLVSLFFLIHLYIARQTIFYAIGSFNYVYPMVGLFLLVAYFRRIDIGKPIQNKWATSSFLLLAFLVGWSQEQIALLTIGFLVFWIGKEIRKQKKVNLLPLAFFITTIIGFLCLYLSPGANARAASKALIDYNNLSLIGKLKITFPAMVDFFIHQQAIFTVLVIVFLVIVCYSIKQKSFFLLGTPIVLLPYIFSIALFGQAKIFEKWFENKLYLCLYGALLLGLIAAMAFYLAIKLKNYLYLVFPLGFILINIATTFTPSMTGGRVAFPAIPLAMVSILLLFHSIRNIGIQRQIAIIIAFCAIFNFYYLEKEYSANAKIQEQRLEIVKQHGKMSKGTLVLPRLKNRSAAGYELDDQEYVMRGFKDYYGINENVIILLK